MRKKTHSVATHIAAALADRIVTGALPPGAPLRQDRVAEEFGASHVPTREAFQMLRAQGLATSEPRRGMRVAPLDAVAIRETVEMRAVLEMLAFRHSAPRLTAAQIETIAAAVRAGEEAGTIITWEAANREFHKALVEPCRMPRLLTALDQLRLANTRIVLAAQRGADWQPRSDHEHRQILEAIRRKDVDCATNLLRRHILGMEQAGDPPD